MKKRPLTPLHTSPVAPASLPPSATHERNVPMEFGQGCVCPGSFGFQILLMTWWLGKTWKRRQSFHKWWRWRLFCCVIFCREMAQNKNVRIVGPLSFQKAPRAPNEKKTRFPYTVGWKQKSPTFTQLTSKVCCLIYSFIYNFIDIQYIYIYTVYIIYLEYVSALKQYFLANEALVQNLRALNM